VETAGIALADHPLVGKREDCETCEGFVSSASELTRRTTRPVDLSLADLANRDGSGGEAMQPEAF
jgi:hypothetical protein